MQKCDLCLEVVSEGEEPACVATCPAEALHFGPLEKMAELAGKRPPGSVSMQSLRHPGEREDDHRLCPPPLKLRRGGQIAQISASGEILRLILSDAAFLDDPKLSLDFAFSRAATRV